MDSPQTLFLILSFTKNEESHDTSFLLLHEKQQCISQKINQPIH